MRYVGMRLSRTKTLPKLRSLGWSEQGCVLQTSRQAFRARNMAQLVQHSLHKSKDPSADLQNPCKSWILSVCLWHWSSYGRWKKKTGDSIDVMRQVVWTTGLRYGKQGLAPEVVLWPTHVSHGMCMPPQHTLRTFFKRKRWILSSYLI